MADLAALVRDTRKQWGVTQEAFGALVGLSGKYISAIENGRRVPQRTERRIRRAIEHGPGPLPQPRRDPLRDLAPYLAEATEVFRGVLASLQDGTRVFVCACTGLPEDDDWERLHDVAHALRTQPRTRIHYLIPTAAAWQGTPPLYDAGRSQTIEAAQRVQQKLAGLGLEDRVTHQEVAHPHCFSPVATLYLFLAPITGAREGQRGLVSVPTSAGTVFITLPHPAVVTAFAWLAACGVDTTPLHKG